MNQHLAELAADYVAATHDPSRDYYDEGGEIFRFTADGHTVEISFTRSDRHRQGGLGGASSQTGSSLGRRKLMRMTAPSVLQPSRKRGSLSPGSSILIARPRLRNCSIKLAWTCSKKITALL